MSKRKMPKSLWVLSDYKYDYEPFASKKDALSFIKIWGEPSDKLEVYEYTLVDKPIEALGAKGKKTKKKRSSK